MAFAEKTDFLGLVDAISGHIAVRSNSDGASNQNLEITGADGSIICNNVFGRIKAPTCEYAITSDLTGFALMLGKAYNSEYPTYALQSYTLATGAGQEPTLNAVGVQIEENASSSTYCTYTPPSVTLSPARHALTFDAFVYTQSCSCTLQDSTFTAECNIDPATINGEPVASDATQGRVTVEVTFWNNSDTTPPEISVLTANGWKQTQDWACTGADSSMFNWTAQFTNYLSAEQA